jgi:glycerol-3-phosphate dehydrogenase (NAD(P)+)
MKLSIIGAGSWGTALSHHLARKGHEVLLWAREPEVASGINESGSNPLFLRDLRVDEGVQATDDLHRVAAFSDWWVWVVPVQHSRAVMRQLSGSLRSEVLLVSASKGIEVETQRRMDELAIGTLGLSPDQFCCVSGPTFAREVLHGRPSAAVVSAVRPDVAQRVQKQLSDRHLRLYTSRDVTGVELCGALKNVVAIAAGVVDGLGLGPNALAALTTRGLHEMTRLGVRLGADADTFRGLAGMGDLMLTCTFGQSRNRTVGERLGRGETLESITGAMREVAEGVRTAPAAQALAARYGTEMPIVETVTQLLAGKAEAGAVVEELMLRSLKDEASL